MNTLFNRANMFFYNVTRDALIEIYHIIWRIYEKDSVEGTCGECHEFKTMDPNEYLEFLLNFDNDKYKIVDIYNNKHFKVGLKRKARLYGLKYKEIS